MSRRNVSDVMRKNVVFVREEYSARRAAVGMQQFNLTQVPIVDDGRLVGIVDRRDLDRIAPNRQGRLFALEVARPVEALLPWSPAYRAAELLERDDVEVVPVVDEDLRIVGVVTRADIADDEEGPTSLAA